MSRDSHDAPHTDSGDLSLRGPLLAEACNALGADFSTDEQYLAAWLSFSERVGSPCPHGPVPDFLTICPGKTGTTWLAHHLDRHPDIYVPPEKELHYFNKRWRAESIDQYQKHFAEAGSQLKGEMTPAYALLPSVAIRAIQRLNPRLKLIFLARRLPERAWSQTRHCFRHYEMTFRNRTAPFSELPAAALAVDFLGDYALTSADYEGILRRWTQFFPAQQFHVRYFEEAVARPEEYLRDVLGFLGAQEELPDEDLRTRINEGVKADLPAWAGRFLESLFASRQREIEAFLQGTFGLKPLWRQPESAGLEPLLLEDRAGGWRIHLQEGAFEAVRPQTGDRIRSRFLGEIRLRIEERDGMHPAAAFTDEDQLLMQVLAELDRDLETAAVRLLGSFQGFSVVHWKRWFFGIRQTLGPVDVTLGEDVLRDRYSTDDFLVASSEKELEARIEALRLPDHLQAASEVCRLVDSTATYNLVEAAGRYFAIAKALGPVELFHEHLGDRELPPVLLAGDSIEEVRRKSEEISVSKTAAVPWLVGSYRGFNLVAHNGRTCALRNSLGPVEVTDGEVELERRFGANDVLFAATVDAARTRIDIVEIARQLADLTTELAAVRSALEAETTGRDGKITSSIAELRKGVEETHQGTQAGLVAAAHQTEDRLNAVDQQLGKITASIAELRNGIEETRQVTQAGLAAAAHQTEDRLNTLDQQLRAQDVVQGLRELHAELGTFSQEVRISESRLAGDLQQINTTLQTLAGDLQRLSSRGWTKRLLGIFSR